MRLERRPDRQIRGVIEGSTMRQLWTLLALLVNAVALQAAEYHLTFGDAPPQDGVVPVLAQSAYDPKFGHGFILVAETPEKPAIFAVKANEDNYRVTVKFGHPEHATDTTIKAESRRLMLAPVKTEAGKYETRTFTVNVRQPPISKDRNTALNDREKGPPTTPNWDEYLTLEFNGPMPGVASLDIVPAKDVVTVFLAGDSTVTDQRNEPYAGWGQMLPRFFGPGVAISNHAESGLALHSFEGQRRLDKVLSMMDPGDYLFIQFGHNDQKDKREGAGAQTTYRANLKKFIAAARSKEGIPVLVTPMERRRFDKNGKATTTLDEYAAVVRQVAEEERVPVIDLQVMSLALYSALGPEQSKRAFAHYPANTFPGQEKALQDDTHHNNFGGYELARCMVEGIRLKVPELAKHLSPDAGTFDPSKPDAPEQFAVPTSPALGKSMKPAGD